MEGVWITHKKDKTHSKLCSKALIEAYEATNLQKKKKATKTNVPPASMFVVAFPFVGLRGQTNLCHQSKLKSSNI